jgi:hypothetical protein
VPLLSLVVVAATAANRRGYDVFAFAEAGAALAVGLDLCPAAIAAAAQERELYLAHIADGSARSVLGHACIMPVVPGQSLDMPVSSNQHC